MDATGDTLIDDTPALLLLGGERHRNTRRDQSQRRRTFNHRLRAAAKQYRAEHPGELPCRSIGFTRRNECQDARRAQQDISDPSRLRNHIEADLRWKYHLEEECPRRQSKRGRVISSLGHESSIELARSKIELPSDRKLQRCPSLERQDAFCDARTRGRVQVTKKMFAAPLGDDDAQVAELYRMGLLYDELDSQSPTGSDINLNDIQHEEPAYSIRPARRSRKSRNNHYNDDLPLNLSFADLGTDNDLAPYLSSQGDNGTSTSSQSFEQQSRRSSQQTAPLRVIYELATSRPSFDIDTSQPPDLMNDSLSEYDCFTDSELDDSPSQREIQDPAGPWVLLGDDSDL